MRLPRTELTATEEKILRKVVKEETGTDLSGGFDYEQFHVCDNAMYIFAQIYWNFPVPLRPEKE